MGAPCAGRPLCRSPRAEVTYGQQPQKSPCGTEWMIRPAEAENVREVKTIASDSNSAPFVINWFCPLFLSLPRKPRLDPSQMPSAHVCNHRRLYTKCEGRKV